MSKKKRGKKSSSTAKKPKHKSSKKELDESKFPTLKLKRPHDIALDFATKTYKKIGNVIKSIVLFGSQSKKTAEPGSDIDIIIIIDDVSVKWDQELIAWYRTELEKILKLNPYNQEIHLNTIRLSTWWDDLLKGDPTIINILRYGEALVDLGGFFEPLKFLLLEGKIKPSPEAIYNCLRRAPLHILRSKTAELNTIEGLFWAMVDSAQAALIAINVLPPSPEHIPSQLRTYFVDSKKLKPKYVDWYRDLLVLHKRIIHGEVKDLKGVEIDEWQEKTEEFLRVMTKLVKDTIKG